MKRAWRRLPRAWRLEITLALLQRRYELEAELARCIAAGVHPEDDWRVGIHEARQAVMAILNEVGW